MGTILAIMIVYTVYFIFTISRYDKNGHYKDRKYKYDKKKSKKTIEKELKQKDFDKLPNEVKFFVRSYKVDLDKINIRGLLKMIGVILGLDIGITAITMTMIFNEENLALEVLVGFVIVMIVYLISLKILGNYFKKKGLCKNE